MHVLLVTILSWRPTTSWLFTMKHDPSIIQWKIQSSVEGITLFHFVFHRPSNYADGFEHNFVKVLVPIDKTQIKERVTFVGIRRIRNNVLQSVANARETSVSMKNLTLIQKIEWQTSTKLNLKFRFSTRHPQLSNESRPATKFVSWST